MRSIDDQWLGRVEKVGCSLNRNYAQLYDCRIQCVIDVFYAGVFGVQPASTHSDNETTTKEEKK